MAFGSILLKETSQKSPALSDLVDLTAWIPGPQGLKPFPGMTHSGRGAVGLDQRPQGLKPFPGMTQPPSRQRTPVSISLLASSLPALLLCGKTMLCFLTPGMTRGFRASRRSRGKRRGPAWFHPARRSVRRCGSVTRGRRGLRSGKRNSGWGLRAVPKCPA